MDSERGLSPKPLGRLMAIGGVWVMIRGELASGAVDRAANLYPVDPTGSGPRCSHTHRRQGSVAAGPF